MGGGGGGGGGEKVVGEEAFYCEGQCNKWFHCCCAGLVKREFFKLKDEEMAYHFAVLRAFREKLLKNYVGWSSFLLCNLTSWESLCRLIWIIIFFSYLNEVIRHNWSPNGLPHCTMYTLTFRCFSISRRSDSDSFGVAIPLVLPFYPPRGGILWVHRDELRVHTFCYGGNQALVAFQASRTSPLQPLMNLLWTLSVNF